MDIVPNLAFHGVADVLVVVEGIGDVAVKVVFEEAKGG